MNQAKPPGPSTADIQPQIGGQRRPPMPGSGIKPGPIAVCLRKLLGEGSPVPAVLRCPEPPFLPGQKWRTWPGG